MCKFIHDGEPLRLWNVTGQSALIDKFRLGFLLVQYGHKLGSLLVGETRVLGS